jgi:hypothetical protein
VPLSDSCTAAKAPIAISLSMLHTVHHTVSLHGDNAGKPLQQATAVAFRRESPFRDHSSVGRALGSGTQAAAARLTGLPIRILQLSPAARLYLTPDDTVSTTSASRSELLEFCLLREKASASELDLGASRESRFKQMLRPPFRLARNEEGGRFLAAGPLQ